MDPLVEELLARFFINGPPIEDKDQLRALRAHVGWWVKDVMSGAPSLVEKTFKEAKLPAPKAKPTSVATVGAIVFNHSKDRLLVVKDTKGQWSVPKGKLDAEESFEFGACREVLEETGVDISRFISTDAKITFQITNIPWVLFIVKLPEHFHQQLSCCRRGEVSKVFFLPISSIPAVKSGILPALRKHVMDGIKMIE